MICSFEKIFHLLKKSILSAYYYTSSVVVPFRIRSKNRFKKAKYSQILQKIGLQSDIIIWILILPRGGVILYKVNNKQKGYAKWYAFSKKFFIWWKKVFWMLIIALRVWHSPLELGVKIAPKQQKVAKTAENWFPKWHHNLDFDPASRRRNTLQSQ